jgi:hypothetical protein
LSARAERQDFLKRYSAINSFGGRLDYSGTPTDKISSSAALYYESTIIGGALSSANPSLPDLPDLGGIDLGLFGTRDRRETLGGSGRVGIKLSPRDELSGGLFAIRTRYRKSALTNDYDGFGGSTGYSRQLSEKMTLGGEASIARYNYRGSRPSTNVYSFQGTIQAKLSPIWSLKGGAGLSISADQGGGRTRKDVAGDISLCRNGDRVYFCMEARRAARPTGFAGTQTETNVNVRYRYRLGERSDFTASAGYTSLHGRRLDPTTSDRSVSGALAMDREVAPRIRLSSSVFYRDVFGGVPRAADYGGQIGTIVRLGDRE